jgi:hypothetical protein
MPLAAFDPLLRALDDGLGEPGAWLGNLLQMRFVQDYTPAALQMTEQGMTQVQTWVYFGRYQLLPGAGVPGIGDIVTVRGRTWEVVEFGTDDLEELQLRLVPYQTSPLEDEPRGPGRPTRRDDILAAWDALVALRAIDPRKPLSRAFPHIRRRLTGSSAPSPGLSDKTLQGVLSSRSAPASGDGSGGAAR